jgi:hypothetical protein
MLTISPDAGVNDMVFDPRIADIIYATSRQRRRATGQFVGGGPESAVYKSTNGGTTWTRLTKGLPQGPMGRIAIGVDPKAKPTRVYVLANALRPESGFHRSNDAGLTSARVGVLEPPPPAAGLGAAAMPPAGAPAAPPAGGRGGAQPADNWYRGCDPGYYHELFVDPIRPDTIWSVSANLERSTDGGKTWGRVPNLGNVHVDDHDVWVNPSERAHIMVANDGGVYETWDEGKVWRYFSNLPVAQFYRVSVKNAKPFYNVCGGAQDNGSVCGPSRTLNRVGIRTSDWYVVGDGDGFQTRSDPDDPNIVYASSQGGAITRLDLRTGQSRSIRARAPLPGSSAAATGAPAGGGRHGGPGQQEGVAAERPNWDAPDIVGSSGISVGRRVEL